MGLLGDHPEEANPEWDECHHRLAWVPICGGWCIPTVSPEQTWIRYLSNENSMFRIFGKSYRIRHVCEHSRCVRRSGRVGFACVDRWRAWWMLLAAVCSVSAWACMMVSAFGMARNPRVIKHIPWATIKYMDTHGLQVMLRTSFGINMYVAEAYGVERNGSHWQLNPDARYETSNLWGSEDACNVFIFAGIPDEESRDALQRFCTECEKSSLATKSFIWMAIVIQIFQIATDLQRLTPFGDLNCQKLLGWSTSFLGLTTGLVAILSFLAGCWRYFPERVRLTPEYNGYTIPAAADRSIGIGCALMFLAVLLKLVDALLHLSLRTPAPKWEPVPTFIPFTAYCQRCSEPTRWGRPLAQKRIGGPGKPDHALAAPHGEPVLKHAAEPSLERDSRQGACAKAEPTPARTRPEDELTQYCSDPEGGPTRDHRTEPLSAASSELVPVAAIPAANGRV